VHVSVHTSYLLVDRGTQSSVICGQCGAELTVGGVCVMLPQESTVSISDHTFENLDIGRLLCSNLGFCVSVHSVSCC